MRHRKRNFLPQFFLFLTIAFAAYFAWLAWLDWQKPPIPPVTPTPTVYFVATNTPYSVTSTPQTKPTEQFTVVPVSSATPAPAETQQPTVPPVIEPTPAPVTPLSMLPSQPECIVWRCTLAGCRVVSRSCSTGWSLFLPFYSGLPSMTVLPQPCGGCVAPTIYPPFPPKGTQIPRPVTTPRPVFVIVQATVVPETPALVTPRP